MHLLFSVRCNAGKTSLYHFINWFINCESQNTKLRVMFLQANLGSGIELERLAAQGRVRGDQAVAADARGESCDLRDSPW